ncbi:transcriptional regulator SplA domain-containing protein [Sutcliffiella cohnii]
MNNLHEGDSIYIFYRNPHTQNVATIEEATIVQDPHSGELALALYNTFYPITEDLAYYTSLEEAETVYYDYFGDTF